MKIVVLGAGNVANHLAKALFDVGFEISQVFSRTEQNAKMLAEKVKSDYTTSLDHIYTKADIYLYMLSDNALSQVISKINIPSALHIHTSGSTSIQIFEGFSPRCGVLYPLQTFSKNRQLDFSKIPVFIEASSEAEKGIICEIVKHLTKQIHFVDSENRKKLHLSAVFVCNFVNHLYLIGSDLVEDANCSFDVLRPLIEETADKINELKPYDAQTGPALRKDESTLEKHQALLSEKKELSEIYRLLSQSVYQRHLEKK